MDRKTAPTILSMKVRLCTLTELNTQQAAVGLPGSFLASALIERLSARSVLSISLVLQVILLAVVPSDPYPRLLCCI